jgi:hypothetical protein|tara:strand:- start:799 stop:1617 length:819 start_codon:yes stop_codon:yes gene_type:complete
MSYKDEITNRIKGSVNNWIDKLKQEHPKLHLTKQWKIDYSNGFLPGHTTLPVVSGSKKGPYLIAEVEFVVPADLELDLESIELTLKNEVYKKKEKTRTTPVPVDEPLSVINGMIQGMNNFLSSLDLEKFTLQYPTSLPHTMEAADSGVKINPGPLSSRSFADDITKVRHEVKTSKHLPEWIKGITSKDVYETLIDKISEGYIQYTGKGNHATLKEFFKMYENYLKREGKLKDWCRYKAKPVELNEKSWCQEAYCSKKPWQKRCEYSTLKFGS